MPDGKITFKASAETKEARKELLALERDAVKAGKSVENLSDKLQAVKNTRLELDAKNVEKYTSSIREADERIDSLRYKIEKLSENKESWITSAGQLPDVSKLAKLYSFSKTPGANAGLVSANAKKWGINLDDYAQYVSYLRQAADAEKQINDLLKQISQQEQLIAANEEMMADTPRAEKTQRELDLEEKLRKAVQDRAGLYEKIQSAKAKVEQSEQNDIAAEEARLKAEEEAQAYEEEMRRKMAATYKLKRVIDGLGNALIKTASLGIKFAKSITVNPILNGFKKLYKSVTSFGRRLKFVMMQGLLFRNMRKYLSEFAQAMGNALKQNEQFNASLANLKGTFWAAIAPVVDAVAPILARFLDMIAKLITYLSGLIGILFGIGKASKAAGKGLATAGQKGKEASNNLASWDTIQNLDKDSGGDIGGVSPTFGQDFEEAYEKLEKLRELFEKGIPFDIGKYVGEELSKVISMIDTWINGTLAPRLKIWAKTLGEFINGFFVGMDWANLGKTLGDAIIAVFDGISVFLRTVNWKKVGESVKEFLLGIPWVDILKSVGQAIIDAIIAGIDFVEGLTGIDLSPWREAWSGLYDIIKDLIDLLSGDMSLKEWFDQLTDNQAIIVTLAVIAGVIAAILTVISVIQKVTATIQTVGTVLNALSIGPMALIIAVIAALIAIIVLVIKHWDEIKETVNKVITAIKEWIQKFVEDVKVWWQNLIDSTKKFIQQIKDFFKGLWDSIVNWFKKAYNDVSAFLQKIVTWIDNKFVYPIINAIARIYEKATSIVQKIRNGIKSAINFIIRIINGLISGVETAINAIVSGINKLSFHTPDWIPLIGGKSFGFNLGSVSLRRIPELAQGAVVNPSHEFAAILGDNRQEQEIVSPLSTMKQALLDALSEYSGNTEVVLEVDGRKFATALVPHINNRSRAYGTSVIL